MVRNFLPIVITLIFVYPARGQTADEVIRQAIENTGGISRWSALEGFRIHAKFEQGGVEFPLEIVQMKDGRKYTRLDFEGTEIMQGVFDGTNLWSTDFQTQQPKRSDAETTANIRMDVNDFPDALFNYSQKSYTAELQGKVNFEGQDAFKIRLVREPMKVDGETVEDVLIYYINSQTFFPLAREFEIKHGPIKGSVMIIRLDDFRDVQGVKFPFSMLQGVKDSPPQPITVETVVLNPKVAKATFAFPGK